MEVYLQQMDQLDHADELNEEVRDSKLKIKEKLQQLKERKINYEKLKQLCEASIDGQVSTIDTDSKAMIHRTNVVAVSYNVQAVV